MHELIYFVLLLKKNCLSIGQTAYTCTYTVF